MIEGSLTLVPSFVLSLFRVEELEEIFKDELATRVRTLGSHHVLVAQSYHQLAELAFSRGNKVRSGDACFVFFFCFFLSEVFFFSLFHFLPLSPLSPL